MPCGVLRDFGGGPNALAELPRTPPCTQFREQGTSAKPLDQRQLHVPLVGQPGRPIFKLLTISPAGRRSQQVRRETVSQAALYFGTDTTVISSCRVKPRSSRRPSRVFGSGARMTQGGYRRAGGEAVAGGEASQRRLSLY